jgi:transposase
MRLYAAFDLHSNTSNLAIVGEDGQKLHSQKVPNREEEILIALCPYEELIQGVVIESTYNWYWLVDMLMEEGYRVHLANPAAIQKYKGLKHSNDTSDAFWLAEMLRLGVLPEGYIYPKSERPVRDLLRKRGHLVRLRTSLIISLQNIITRSCGSKLNVNKIKQLKTDWVMPFFEEHEDLALSGQVSKETIDFLTRQIKKVEKIIEGKARLKPEYELLLTIPGVGKILALTIMLETGTVTRFPRVGDYSSYCRKVPTKWISNGKKKGQGNKKNGNKYLAWAFSEAAELSRRYDTGVHAWYSRKLARTNRMVAHSSLAHKLVRAAYHVMSNQEPFDPAKCFA